MRETAVRKRKIKDPIEDRILYTVSYTILILFSITVMYPIVYVIASSLSSGVAVSTGQVVIWPVDLSFDGYVAVFHHKRILSGYLNTIFYTVLGTFINVSITMIAAYPLARRDMQWKKFYMFLFTFTMFFGGGLIPTYILITQIHMINTIWAVLIPGALNVYNMILARTFIMNSIPNELLDSAQIDGCSDIRYFFSIVLPLSRAVMAVITLFYAVSHWNSYFDAMMYLNNPDLHPLQLILRQILINSQIVSNDFQGGADIYGDKIYLENVLKYALIVVSSVPIIALYPFIQKYFVKGVMIGSLKG